MKLSIVISNKFFLIVDDLVSSVEQMSITVITNCLIQHFDTMVILIDIRKLGKKLVNASWLRYPVRRSIHMPNNTRRHLGTGSSHDASCTTCTLHTTQKLNITNMLIRAFFSG